MIMNIFSIFDPIVRNFFLLNNWSAIYLGFILIPINYWVISSRFSYLLNNIVSYLSKEFFRLISKSPFALLVIMSLFLFIIFNNVIRLFPYIFNSTGHLSLCLNVSLPFWLGIIIYRLSQNIYNFLIHVIPLRTPFILMPLIVLIETLRNMIRPFTLAIRLTANIISGHLLIVLLRSGSINLGLLSYFGLLGGQILLNILETAVSFIQSYVFRILLVMYSAEGV